VEYEYWRARLYERFVSDGDDVDGMRLKMKATTILSEIRVYL